MLQVWAWAALVWCGLSSPADIVSQSDVVWQDAVWANDGTGCMPVGNGDVTGTVWVDNMTGELSLLVSKTDVFDQNAQPVHTGLVRVEFEPPLWSTPAPASWSQTLNLAEASIDIKTPELSVRVFVDAAAAVLRISAESMSGTFDVRARVEPYRKNQPTQLGRDSRFVAGFCHERFDTADVVVSADAKPAELASAAVWYHRNPDNASYFSDTMRDQGVDPVAAGLKDPLAGLTFGAAIFGDGLQPLDSESVAGQSLTVTTVNIALVTKQDSAEAWMEEMGQLVSKTTVPDMTKHADVWAGLWGRSYLNISAAAGASSDEQLSAKSVMDHAHWQRFLELVQGTQAHAPMRHNGQAFTVNDSAKGWDYRDWGGSWWWQNTRQPYYNSLAQGDVDVLRGMLNWYHALLPYVQERTRVQFAATETPITGVAALYPETMTMFGCYEAGDWGCDSGGQRDHGAAANAFIRFHWTGSLELCLLFLDDLSVTQEADYFVEKGLPVCTAILEGFRQRFPKVVNGKTDMWPTQSLETYQCIDPTSRDDCPANTPPDIAGLSAVLSRMLALPDSIVAGDSAFRTTWAQQLASVPPLPVVNGTVQPMGAGSVPRWNAENTILYPVHPFRIYGVGKPDLDIATATYAARMNPCNNGWCQDVVDAAMLGMVNEAQALVIERAAIGTQADWRFPGFGGHWQDYEPSLDHFAWMRTALNYMLLSPLDDEKQSLLLFPTWPVDKWDVSFKLTGPKNTVIEASCQGGILTRFDVTPVERKADIQVLNCKPADEVVV